MKTIKRSNNIVEALSLPTICNMNPRSVYNKVKEFHEFVASEEIDILFMSESWEREDKTLKDIINLENHTVVSNVYQRKGQGGRPALIVDCKKYDIRDLTNTVIPVKWGVEVVWALLTPKNVTQSSKIKKIACAAIYVKPGSKHKTDTLDHISDAFNILNTKYGRGLHFILAGDTNELRLKPILDLGSNLVQIVTKPTRTDKITKKESILDPIIMTMAQYYQEPDIVKPLDSDPDKNGKPADHNIVLCKPISTINNIHARVTKSILVQPVTEAGLNKMKNWLMEETWDSVIKSDTADSKATVFQNTFLTKYNEFFPKKTLKLTNVDQPWMTQKLKKLDRQRKRIYHKHRKSEKWEKLDKQFKKEMKGAKSNFYTKMVSDLKVKNPSQWYSAVKRMTAYENKADQLFVDEISHLSDQEQCERIADDFSEIPNTYRPLHKEDIHIPKFSNSDIPQFKAAQVWKKITSMKSKKSCLEGDVPANIFKHFAAYLAEPLADIINCSITTGSYPNIWKEEFATPIPKSFPTQKLSDLRNISGLLNCDKISEALISELIISDMEENIDSAQYGNRKGKSINHYLIKMLNRILLAVDKNTRKETFAVVATLIDWSKAFPRQCPKLGVESFMKNGVRPSLIPVLTSFFQNRKMTVKWHGCKSTKRDLNGGGPAGSTLGLLEYLSQSNNNADVVSPEDRFKFVDDLTALEIVNLLTVGLTSFHLKVSVPNDIPCHNQYIQPEKLKTQEYLNEINLWTIRNKMLINQKKTKAIIFNFTDKYQFSTRLKLNNEIVEIVPETKLLGTIIQNDLKWDSNTANLVKRANSRMVLLRKLSEFGAPREDLKTIYISYIRSVLEQSAVVWHFSLTEQNKQDLERVQKSAFKIILKNKYENYHKSLEILDLIDLNQRRIQLCKVFAIKSNKNSSIAFELNDNCHAMENRKTWKYKVSLCRTERLKKSSIPGMQELLNQD